MFNFIAIKMMISQNLVENPSYQENLQRTPSQLAENATWLKRSHLAAKCKVNATMKYFNLQILLS